MGPDDDFERDMDLREAGIPPGEEWTYTPHEPRLAMGHAEGPITGPGRGDLTPAQRGYLAAIDDRIGGKR